MRLSMQRQRERIEYHQKFNSDLIISNDPNQEEKWGGALENIAKLTEIALVRAHICKTHVTKMRSIYRTREQC